LEDLVVEKMMAADEDDAFADESEGSADDFGAVADSDADDGAVDILDLTAAIPPVAEPVVAVNKSDRPYSGRFAAKCIHSGSEVSSGSTGSDDSGDDDEKQRARAFVDDDEELMTQKDKQRVKRFMRKYTGSLGKKTKSKRHE
jgi:hypothetical protein